MRARSSQELKKFSKELAAKPRWLVINKRDLLPEAEAQKRARAIVRRLRFRGPHFLISAATGDGTRSCARRLWRFWRSSDRAGHGRASPAADTVDERPASA